MSTGAEGFVPSRDLWFYYLVVARTPGVGVVMREDEPDCPRAWLHVEQAAEWARKNLVGKYTLLRARLSIPFVLPGAKGGAR
jgi:hypothetical protein